MKIELREVLNAFRHQRINHAISPIESLHPSRVLNAFRHQRINHEPWRQNQCRHPRCAQRLSASKDKSPGVGLLDDFLRAVVLNAFRQQRIKHTTLLENRCVVVMARAQRLSASKDKSLVSWHSPHRRGFKCSTPFGIKG